MAKIIKWIITIVVIGWVLYCLFFLWAMLYSGGAFYKPIDYKKMEVIFEKDYELLHTMAEYLEAQSYEELAVFKSMQPGEFLISGTRTTIDDITIVETVEELKVRGYYVFWKEGSIINFTRCGWRGKGTRGIVLFVGGEIPENAEYARLEKLSKENWYYFESK